MMKMVRFHLVITLFNPFFQGKLKARGKIDSVWFYDYDYLFEKILSEMSLSEIDSFKLNLFQCYKYHLSFMKINQFVNGEVLQGYTIPSVDINVPTDIIASCISSRKIRDKYFEYDCLRERYYLKSSFIYYLKH